MTDGRLLRTFLDLVRIDSPSRSESVVAAYCGSAFEARGFEVRFDDTMSSTGADIGNLIATRHGDSERTLVLSAHMDCVEPCRGVEPVVVDGVVSSAGQTVLGADDKAGIAAILEAVDRLDESGAHTPALKIILTVCEELGLHGAKALDPADAAGDLCLVLDADGEPGGIVIGAPTHYTFVATFQGTASHAGVAPERGRSALVMASRAIAAMQLGRLDENTTANIGTVEGGIATNVVAAFARVTGECRSLLAERADEVRLLMDQAMREAARTGDGQVDIAWTKEYEGFLRDSDDTLVVIVSDACREVGLQPRTFTTGGGSDGNVFSSDGTPTLVLSCGMRNVHSTDETVHLADMDSIAALIVAVASRVADPSS
ncbi:MAG: M20/M25/M40 family metallo-hydrolase [Actinomycetota bacterium]|nr:M20/M25/M40 family metallo-hydrolase [Actinomycetota bacterium]